MNITTNRKPFLLALMMLAGSFAFAQTDSTNAVPSTSITDSTSIPKHAIGLNLGAGIGLEYAYGWKENFVPGLRFNYLPFSLEGMDYDYEGQPILLDIGVKWMNLDLFADYHPFKGKSFKFIVGASFSFNDFTSFNIRYNDSISFGNFTYTSDDVGYLDIQPSWATVRPYLGMGFGRKHSAKKRLALNIEGGCYYGGAPSVNIEADGMLKDNEDQGDNVASGISHWRYIPYGAITLVYRLK